MAEELKYISPEYNERLTRLAELLCTPDRFSIIQQNVQLELEVD